MFTKYKNKQSNYLKLSEFQEIKLYLKNKYNNTYKLRIRCKIFLFRINKILCYLCVILNYYNKYLKTLRNEADSFYKNR